LLEDDKLQWLTDVDHAVHHDHRLSLGDRYLIQLAG
jgi:hypothetical protein